MTGTAEEHVRLALQSVRAMRPTSAIDLDRQELAVSHLHAALWPETPTSPAPEVGQPGKDRG
jgi:hypothetical protein